ncbi:unnamed protein product, partial [Prorocentrum cordatum]
MSVLEEDTKDDLGHLIEAAGLGEPALRTYLTTKQLKSWTEGRTFAEWVVAVIRYSWAGLLHGRITVASVLNHIDKVTRLVADTASPAPLAERNALAYDQLVWSTAWAEAKRKADPAAFAAAMSGDKEDLVTQAEKQAKEVKLNAPSASTRTQRKPGAVHFCFRHFSGKCDMHERGKTCVFHHECPRCAKTQEGCPANRIKPLGLELIKTRDK